MANKIIPKRSSVSGKVPATTDLDVGEIAVNLTDRKIYTKDSGGTVVQLGGGAGSGDVVGPNSSTDNAIARFDLATGKLIQNSGATIDDSGNLTATSNKASGTGANKMPVGTSAQRPAGEAGLYRMNSETGEPEWFNAASGLWVPFADKSRLSADYLVIAGGGGGGYYSGGGGGAGGYLEGTGLTLNTGQAYTVTVGAGGVRGTSSQSQTNGSNSQFGTFIATGGGAGSNVGGAGSNGGSGGGGGGLSGGAGGSGISGQGYAGGTGYPGRQLGGGGGGANAAGNNYNSGSVAGSGGAGKTSSISGSAVTRGGGGGGGSQDIYSGAGGGGAGGGGSGGFAAAGSSGADNYGGGGGGGGNSGGAGQNGGNGGSGVVIVRIPSKFSATFSAGVTSSLDSTSAPGFKIYTVTSGTGTVTFAEA